MSFVYGAAKQVGEAISRYALVATKSTVPIGTADKIRCDSRRGESKSAALKSSTTSPAIRNS